MKKTIKTGLILLSLFSAWYFGHTTSDKNPMNELMFKNVEALANNENGQSDKNYSCVGTGEIDCYGDKVDTKYEGYSLD